MKNRRFYRIGVILLVMALATLCIPAVALADEASLGITTSNVHMRAKAATTADSLGILAQGTQLTLKGHEGSWYKATVNGKTGYVNAKYVTIQEINRTLKKGDSGDDVKYLQRTLKELNYYTGEIDGKLGDATVKAVVAFQKAASLTADGKVGSLTWAKLQASTGTTKSSSAATAALRKGDSGDNVRQLQRLLKACGYLSGSVDGEFGAATEKAVIVFQTAVGLTADGVAGSVTLARLNQENEDPTALALGDTGDLVKNLQNRLKALGFYSDSLDGEYGNGTKKAVTAFQVKYELKADGIAGVQTLAKLFSLSVKTTTTAKSTAKSEEKTYTAPAANGVELSTWKIKKLITYHDVITVYDIKSGKSYQVREFSAGNHADVEPLTAADTATIKEINGSFTWTARPVWVTWNGRTFAASIHSNPHDVSTISDNNFNGHICLHFKGSSTHNGNTSYTQEHQNAVTKAWEAAQAAS